MSMLPLKNQERKILRKWLQSHIDKDASGNPINHRIWFKNIFNPFLRSMGLVIVSKVNDEGKISGYEIRKYPLKKS